MQVFNEEPNKFHMWEIVNILDNNDELEQGFVTKIRQFPNTGIWEYSIYEYKYGCVVDYFERKLESTGEFLPQDEIDDRIKIISRKNKFDFREIVRVIQYPESEYIRHKGYIDGMSQDYDTGEWGYGISLLKPIDDNHYISGLKEEDLVSTGEFKPKEETMSNMSFKVSTAGEVTDVTITDPKTWEDKVIADRWKK